MEEPVDPSTTTIEAEIQKRKRAECMAHVQTYTVRLALDLLVREPDLKGFFRGFIKLLIDDGESDACGVFILDDEGKHCELKMAYADDRFFKIGEPGWETLNLPARDMSEHLFAYEPGWNETIEYAGDDARLPESVREFQKSTGVQCLVVTPLALPTRNLGWIALSTAGRHATDMGQWQRILLEAVALQVTLALHQKQLTQKSRDEERRKAILEERNRIARDIHDTLAQGFGAILMQLQAAQRSTATLPPAVARSLETAVDLARTHMIDARRSVSALRPQPAETEDVAAALVRMTDLARRTTDIPIELDVAPLPPLGGGIDREIIGIAQEALTNAVRHARARQISVQASSVRSVGFRLSVADDGRGIAREHRGAGFGMTSMQERAERIGASLTIVTAPRSGTEVVLAWEPPSFSIPGSADAVR
jgi:signal transduction histidine kinase